MDKKLNNEEKKTIEFITTEEYTPAEIKKVQEVLLIMAKHVHWIFEKHKIPYFITYGTLLGSVRHQGFIPWDDDFDIFIFDEDYDEAVEYLRKELPKWMIVHDEKTDPIYWPYWSRLRDLNTTMNNVAYTDDANYKYQGINLDLYRLKKTKRSQIDLSILKENLSFYQRKHAVGIVKDEVFASKQKELKDKIEKMSQMDFPADDDEVYYYVGAIKLIDKKAVFPLKKYKFEDMEFLGPADADFFLKQAYGDNYMQLPELKDRKSHCSSIVYRDPDFKYE